MKTRSLSTIGIAAFAVMFLANAMAFGAVTVSTVPWTPATPTTPHTTYPLTLTTEAAIILGATVPSAVGARDTVKFQWNFGEWPSSALPLVKNPYSISPQHQDPSSAATGTQWTATVTVTDI